MKKENDLQAFLEKYPHNWTLSDYEFGELVEVCYHSSGSRSPKEFCQECLHRYGGTLADALVNWILNFCMSRNGGRKMKLNLVMYCCVCAPEEFTVNGVEAERWDFGRQFDACPEQAEPYGCGNMVFEPKPPTPEVLEKYKITEEEYQEVAKKLKEKLSFGWCYWCV